ncbi:TPA: hypothetical protein KRD69_003663 [Clostridioides difficile]|uniref:hypothetical protein n=1 Tax=Clostridioides difficile TaxID=1496 RepID=UPI001C13CC87|nr:hypothetical protein [Clostridioides difficile]MCR8821273.1 hypothetical protein [Clostridioides difficile]MCZ1087148.1 hypothetical protein [Clostridioides difficile]MDB2781139.1 hypothetical protein [Clostridioides difficile]MDV9236527.1 hypothetical protein [Clostridioides difficile]
MWQKFKNLNLLMRIIIACMAICFLPITLVIFSIEFLMKAIRNKNKGKVVLGCFLALLTLSCARTVYLTRSLDDKNSTQVNQVSSNKDKEDAEKQAKKQEEEKAQTEQQKKDEETKKLAQEKQKKNEDEQKPLENKKNNEPTKFFNDVYLKNKNCVNMASYEGIKSNIDIFGYKYKIIEPNETTLRQIDVYDNQSNDTIQFQFYENDTGEEVVTVMQYNKKDEPDKSVAISDDFHIYPPKFNNHINNTNTEVNSIEEQIKFIFN